MSNKYEFIPSDKYLECLRSVGKQMMQENKNNNKKTNREAVGKGRY